MYSSTRGQLLSPSLPTLVHLILVRDRAALPHPRSSSTGLQSTRPARFRIKYYKLIWEWATGVSYKLGMTSQLSVRDWEAIIASQEGFRLCEHHLSLGVAWYKHTGDDDALSFERRSVQRPCGLFMDVVSACLSALPHIH